MSDRVTLQPVDAANVTVFEPIIPRTISELAAIALQVIVPGHCTGWKATHELSRQLPDAYLQTSVGTRLQFSSP